MKTIEIICPKMLMTEDSILPLNAKSTLIDVALNVYKDYKIYTEITPCIIHGYDITAYPNDTTVYKYNALKLVTVMPDIIYDGIVRDLKRNFENDDLHSVKSYADSILVGEGTHYTIENKFIVLNGERIAVCVESSTYIPGKREYYSQG